MHDQDPADDRHDVVTRLMAENDKLKTEIARLESECRGWNAETKAGFFRQADDLDDPAAYAWWRRGWMDWCRR